VGGEHLVVFGGDEPSPDPDAALVPAAAHLVAVIQKVSPAKLLADELEVAHAIRNLIEYRPELVVETARHIAGKAAEPLACEVGAVLLHCNGSLVAEVVTRNWSEQLDAAAIRSTLITLFERAEQGAFVELELEAAAGDALGRDRGLVARFAVPIGRPKPLGYSWSLTRATRARGFTNLCQRIGSRSPRWPNRSSCRRSRAKSSLRTATVFARQARIDPLTGLERTAPPGRACRGGRSPRRRYARSVTIVSADLDISSPSTTATGTESGDRLIRAAANLLRRHARGSDRIRQGGVTSF